jgi:colicin import membrane protein
MSEADGIEDAVDGAMRTGLMVAARIGEQLARMREQEQRTIAAAEEQRARELQERFDAQRAAARAQLAPATAWKAYDPEAAQVYEKISEQVQSRYDIDVNNTGADEASVSEGLARAELARLEAENERIKSSAARTDGVVAAAAIAGANRQDRADRSEPAWDTAERRKHLAQSLEGKGDREAVNSRLLADKHQGTRPAAAVEEKPSLAKTPKTTQRGGQGMTLERGGLER